MTDIVTDDVSGQSTEATGHPTDCTEPVPGVVQGTSHSVTVTSAGGDSAPVATKLSTLHFDSHSHDHTSAEGCHEDASHDLTDADFDTANMSDSLTINGEPVMIVADAVSTDPKTSDDVNVTGSGINGSISESP